MEYSGWVAVSYHQYQLRDDLAQPPDIPHQGELINDEADEGSLGIRAFQHTGRIKLTVRILAAPPSAPALQHRRHAEAVLVSESGELYVCEWGSGPVEGFPNLAADGPGSYRIRVQAPANAPEDAEDEEHQIEIWLESA
ncbi:hypothetical protein [Actinomadura yumaensis]|uniref:Uncharacterized protein n=1 Tax=Actinomadura yumaensis TaxID=111807 RepID=A0ABW2CP60_9ACTN